LDSKQKLQQDQKESKKDVKSYDEIRYCQILLNKLDTNELKRLQDTYPQLQINLYYKKNVIFDSIDDNDCKSTVSDSIQSKKKYNKRKSLEITNPLDFILK
jgi:hypothetical protein